MEKFKIVFMTLQLSLKGDSEIAEKSRGSHYGAASGASFVALLQRKNFLLNKMGAVK